MNKADKAHVDAMETWHIKTQTERQERPEPEADLDIEEERAMERAFERMVL